MALPPGAVLEVSLQDVSRADAAAVELSGVRLEDPGNPPFEFEISYDPEKIDQRHSYAVRATIRAGGKLLFTTDTNYPVLTRGAGNEVDLLLRRVGGKPRDAGATLLGGLPASFEGELPCADCPGIFYHLDLLEERVFFLRTTYLGRGTEAIRDSVGSWVLSSEDRRLVLFGGAEAPIFFRVVDTDTIRKLDVEGKDIESALNYDLRRKDEIGTIEPRLDMRGMYQYMADAALFTECLSGRKFPVATEGDNLALERAYLEARREPGEQLLVSLTGRIAVRPKMEGDGVELTVIPERFGGVWPGETCGARGSVSELEDNYWKLTRLGAGTGGCNRFTGTYEIQGEEITFGALATTMMACPDVRDVDLAMMAALEKATSFRKTAHHLELFDADGTVVARFEATELQ
jgi:copper homeostasis protein (lipoprotein)